MPGSVVRSGQRQGMISSLMGLPYSFCKSQEREEQDLIDDLENDIGHYLVNHSQQFIYCNAKSKTRSHWISCYSSATSLWYMWDIADSILNTRNYYQSKILRTNLRRSWNIASIFQTVLDFCLKRKCGTLLILVLLVQLPLSTKINSEPKFFHVYYYFSSYRTITSVPFNTRIVHLCNFRQDVDSVC